MGQFGTWAICSAEGVAPCAGVCTSGSSDKEPAPDWLIPVLGMLFVMAPSEAPKAFQVRASAAAPTTIAGTPRVTSMLRVLALDSGAVANSAGKGTGCLERYTGQLICSPVRQNFCW